MSSNRLALLESGFGLGGYIPRAIDSKAAPSRIPTSDRDRYWMAQALLEAMEAVGRASPNPSVGSVIVEAETCISRGSTQAYGSYHAERMALTAAGARELASSECYVTLEPCGGTGGKQGPCADLIVASGIKRVIIGSSDPHIKAAGLGLAKLKAAGIKIDHALTNEANAWHFPFLAYQQKQKPILIGKWAQTLDGHLADDQGKSQWISGPKSRAYTHWLRQKYDAIMVGVNTVLVDAPKLTARDSALPHARHPHKIIYDPKGRLETASREALDALFDSTDSKGPLVYWCTGNSVKAPAKTLAKYQDRLVHLPIIVLGDWDKLILGLSARHQEIFGHELQSILVEGGSQLLTLLMRADQLDACHIFVRAGVLGGSKHRIGRMHRGENPSRDLMERDDYRLLATQQIEDDVLIECVHGQYDFWT